MDKSDWSGWAGLANSQARNGQFDIALEAYMKSLEINTGKLSECSYSVKRFIDST